MIRRFSKLSLTLITALAIATPSLVRGQDEFESLQLPSRDLASQIVAAQGRRVAVVDFTDLRGRTLELGRAIAEEVASVLVREKSSFQVVDRLSMAALLKEHSLTVSGLIDPKTAKEFGRVSGVDVLVTGTLTPLGDTVRVTLKAIDTETATMLGSATGRIRRSTAIDRLLRIETSGDSGSPSSGPGDYEGVVRFERYRNLDVGLESLQVLKAGDIVVALRLRNARSERGGLAIAFKAEYSGGIADFWKFFPAATAYATDSQGNRYRVGSVTGLGFAREPSDWTILGSGDEIPITLTFTGGSRVRQEDSFSIAVELWYAETSEKRQPITITFRDIRPK